MNKKLVSVMAIIILSVIPSYGHDKEQDVSVLYKNGHYQKVIDLLNSKPIKDEKSSIYLGLSYLKLKHLDQTVSVWKEYAKTTPGGETTRRLSQYITPLLKESAKEGAQKARQEEKSLSASNLDPNIVAVAPFQNKGSPEYDPLSTGFAEMVITDLSQVKTLKVVERIRVQALLNELKLSQSGLVDLNSAPQVGKLLGAGKITSGGFADADKKKLRINLSMVQTQEGQILSEKESEGTLLEFYKLEKSLVVQVLCGMGRCPESLDEQTQAAVNKVHTTSFKAFLLYSKGLELRDQGRYREARKAFLQALASDPQFHLAQGELLETPLFPIMQEFVFSEENNFSDNEKPIGEMPLSRSLAFAADGKNDEGGERKKDEQVDEEKRVKASSSPEGNTGNNSPLLGPEEGNFLTILPVEQQPSTVFVPVKIKLKF